MAAMEELTGFKNADLALPLSKLLENIQTVQRHQNLPLSLALVTSPICDVNLDVEMETGTGKTYCYIKTMFEMNKAHLEKEQALFDQGIKVLTLFFIDEVAKYRQYNDAGEQSGEYAQIFEEEYVRLRDETVDLLTSPAYARHLKGIFTQEKPKDSFAKAKKVNRHIYEYVFTDSKNEREFVTELDTGAEVVVYAKLPRGFFIPTPVGNYNPEWAIAFQQGKVKHVFFVAETKGSMSTLDLREIEDRKIQCARKFFAKISSEQVKYDVVDKKSQYFISAFIAKSTPPFFDFLQRVQEGHSRGPGVFALDVQRQAETPRQRLFPGSPALLGCFERLLSEHRSRNPCAVEGRCRRCPAPAARSPRADRIPASPPILYWPTHSPANRAIASTACGQRARWEPDPRRTRSACRCSRA